jgi:hypothetical protein
MYDDLRKAAGDDPMSFTFDELLYWYWARPLKMVADHRKRLLKQWKFSKMSGRPNVLSEMQLFVNQKESNG